jgi:hypothetical protein
MMPRLCHASLYGSNTISKSLVTLVTLTVILSLHSIRAYTILLAHDMTK